MTREKFTQLSWQHDNHNKERAAEASCHPIFVSSAHSVLLWPVELAHNRICTKLLD
jgi:hypothetical protein